METRQIQQPKKRSNIIDYKKYG
jgi:hypothetical protein